MRILSIAAGVVAGATCVAAAAADPSRLLAPDDTAYRSGWRPPPSPTAGLKLFRPVEAGNWLELNAPEGGKPMSRMPGMGGGR